MKCWWMFRYQGPSAPLLQVPRPFRTDAMPPRLMRGHWMMHSTLRHLEAVPFRPHKLDVNSPAAGTAEITTRDRRQEPLAVTNQSAAVGLMTFPLLQLLRSPPA